MADPIQSNDAAVSRTATDSSSQALSPDNDEFAGMTIEQVQREMRKRRANDESLREHISLFGGVAAQQQPAVESPLSEAGEVIQPIPDMDEFTSGHAPRTTLQKDAIVGEPHQQYQQQRPAQPTYPGAASASIPPTASAPSYNPGGLSSGYNPTGQRPQAPAAPYNPSANIAPASPAVGWSPAPYQPANPGNQQSLGDARKALYGTTDDPFAAMPSFRQSSVESSETARKILFIVGGIIAIALIGWLIYVIVPMPVKTPTSFTNYISPDQQFLISAPEGWAVTRTTSKSSDIPNNETTFKAGADKVDVELLSDSQSAFNKLMNQAYYSGNALTDPAGLLHQSTEWRGTYTHQRYKEQMPLQVDCNFGPMDYSEFTGAGGLFGWGGQMHGYRATVNGSGVGVLVLCECPEADWVKMQPVFMQILKTVGPADGSTYTPPPPPSSNPNPNSEPGSNMPTNGSQIQPGESGEGGGVPSGLPPGGINIPPTGSMQ